jgi:hypothetical protein
MNALIKSKLRNLVTSLKMQVMQALLEKQGDKILWLRAVSSSPQV